MTTIAYRDGVFASDSQAHIDCILPYSAKKLHRLHDGGIAGACGERQEIMTFVAWLNTDRKGKRPPLRNSTVIELRSPGGALILHETSGSFEQECMFMAWGSGAVGALGALHMGASAKKAVEVASLLDAYTGGPILTMELENG